MSRFMGFDTSRLVVIFKIKVSFFVVLQNGDDMEVACNEEVCDGQESSVEESSDEYQTPGDY